MCFARPRSFTYFAVDTRASASWDSSDDRAPNALAARACAPVAWPVDVLPVAAQIDTAAAARTPTQTTSFLIQRDMLMLSLLRVVPVVSRR